MRSRILLAGGLLVMIACTRQEPPQPAENASPKPPPVANTTPAPAPAPAPAPPTAPSPAIATAEGRTPGVRAEVIELRRTSGGTLTLKFSLVNDSKQTINVSDILELLDLGDPYPVGGVHLIDPVGRKKYFVARDSENKCVCSVFRLLNAGDRANHWAKFPAPPDDVQRISVVLPTFSPMDDVPIGR